MHLPDPDVQKVVKDELQALLMFPRPPFVPNQLPLASFENVGMVEHDYRDFREITSTPSFPSSFLFPPPRRRTDIWRTCD